MRELGEKFFEAGFDAAGILLPGHGTIAEDLEIRSWMEWYDAVENKLIELKPKYSKIFLCGQSMGGCLSLLVAARHEISGVITIASGIRLYGWSLIFLPIIQYFVRFIRKRTGPDVKDPVAKAKEVHYDLMPVKSIIQLQALLKELREQINKVTAPVLLIHAKEDHTFDFKNQQMMFEVLGSSSKRKIILENSYHIATMDFDKSIIHKEAIQFIKELCR
jgi:carboxylesterase